MSTTLSFKYSFPKKLKNFLVTIDSLILKNETEDWSLQLKVIDPYFKKFWTQLVDYERSTLRII